MIPLYRSSSMEQTVNLMSKHFRQVVVDAAYYCRPAIRIRANKLHARVYFARVPSQVTAWQNGGGVLLRWDRKHDVGEYEAIFYSECPRSTELLDRAAQGARWMSVVYMPPVWRIHFENIERRLSDVPKSKLRAVKDGMERMKQLVESSPRFTSQALGSLLLAHQGQIIPPSSSLVLPAGAERAAGRAPAAP